MTKRVVVHVGAPKSGTTYLQRVLRHNEPALRAQGVLVAGRTHTDLVHAGFVVRGDRRLEQLPARAARAWDRVVGEVRDFDGEVAVISYELLAAAGRDQAARALAPLADLEVHVVVTTRDLGRSVPSAWQERLKFGLDVPLGSWHPRPEEDGPRAEWGWRTMDPAGVADRWGSSLPPERVHIVTSPRSGTDPALLWERFAEAAGLSGTTVDLAVPAANESLGARAAEVLRRVNEQDLGPIRGAREQSRWLRDTLAHAVLAGLDDEPLGITEEQLVEARERAAKAVATIRASGWQVHGDLTDLEASARTARLPEQVGAEELLPVATQAIVALLLELREARSGAEGRERGARRRRLSASRSSLEDLEEQVAALQAELQETRRLHERVAALSDLVTELLLPGAQADRKTMRKALRTYRRESL